MSSVPAGYSSEAQQAAKLGKTIRTLRLWRQKRTGPPWTLCGNTVLYRDESTDVWLKSQEQQPVRSQRNLPLRKTSVEPAAA
jgi:hypothetical protein